MFDKNEQVINRIKSDFANYMAEAEHSEDPEVLEQQSYDERARDFYRYMFNALNLNNKE